MTSRDATVRRAVRTVDPDAVTIGDALAAWRSHRRLIAATAFSAGALAYGGSWLMAPVFIAEASVVARQAKPSASADLLEVPATMTSGSIKNLAEQYIGLMKSATVADTIVRRFDLRRVYGEPLAEGARRALDDRTQIAAGPKDGVIAIEVEDSDPQRAAAIANAYVDGLRETAARLAITDAQRRRQFFESRLPQASEQLARAEAALREGAGFDAGALRALPRASGERHARLIADAGAGEIALETARAALGNASPQLEQLRARAEALRDQLAQDEDDAPLGAGRADAGYLARLREFEYRRRLHEQVQRQIEQARVDEGREGPVIQALDVAEAPERKSRPWRALIALGAAGAGLLAAAFVALCAGARPGAARRDEAAA
jgi:uncharacterized protein involved in exopolysaccharide biosynthesis